MVNKLSRTSNNGTILFEPHISPHPSTMSTFAANLASLARSKLHSGLSSGSRDNLSLHRWVLLKNSISRDVFAISAHPTTTTTTTPPDSEVFDDDDVEEDFIDEDIFSFLFPDPGHALTSVEDENVSEAQWLDSLLEKLADDEDENPEVPPGVTLSPIEEDERFKWDAIPSNKLNTQHSHPFHPPLMHTYDIDSPFTSSYSDPPPYFVEDPYSPVPEAIEDTSDDESESPTTPFTYSQSSLSLVDPASIPLPHDRQREPHVFSDADNSLFYHFDLSSIPYPDTHSPVYNPFHQSC
ncbi:hypothetical protein BD410DRAFT_713710 [Rickenella mellea]|uniref:Uncharacterized protein n=1 Tax=Rickenella mellea TaxID=50990 RepID=A0A4Y7QIQ0_9AGAM|nr:hypothetical protein BD410DRAFT_713710 [Rickenella mellea]